MDIAQQMELLTRGTEHVYSPEELADRLGEAGKQGRQLRIKLGLDPTAPALLGWNQIAFMAMIIAYSAWRIYAGLTGPGPYGAQIANEPALAPMLAPIAKLHATLTVIIYGTLIAAAILFQGLTARYYFSRRRRLLEYLQQTPKWILDIQRTTARH
ncbi:hypothetical protein LCGC14_2660190 [marine sediment metagenome]|uniref:MotA/TolQ/ExbB proton channel domain-containing protein n=1 Tax=marine sediment metagenome TaxID=412755 RepID=A0A0F9C2C7_9ZZZZ